jgi:hypothetical protein
VVAMAVVLGVLQLRDGKVFYLRHSDGTAARLGAMRLAGGPAVVIEPTRLAYTPAVLETFIMRYGAAPMDTEAQLARALPESRAAADQVLADADARRPGPLRSCRAWPSGLPLPQRFVTIAVVAVRPARVSLVRFASPPGSVSFSIAPPGTRFALRRDAIKRPWRLTLPPGATARVCS